MTHVPEAVVRDTYEQVKQQLPSSAAADGFVAAQQMGITQLAVKYCNVMASTASYRDALFPGLNMNQSHFDEPSKTLIKTAAAQGLVIPRCERRRQRPGRPAQQCRNGSGAAALVHHHGQLQQ